MKYLFFLFFFLTHCSSITGDKTQKIYICGDHECADKKEINNYFKNNISIEVYTLSDSTKKDYDLVELNMTKEDKNEIVSTEIKRKKLKESLKKRPKVEKVKVNKGENITEAKVRINKQKIVLVRICKDIQECDIDEVANKIFKIGNEKKFPDLTVK